jgi:hypothetical protein
MAVWETQVGRPTSAGFHIKRTHPNRRREFPWGIPRPYAWPQPTFLGAAVDNTRFEWEQWVKQALSTLLARSAVATAVTETTDTAAANRSFAVIQSKRERIAAVLREEYPPHGTPRRGQGWDKEAKETLKARGIDTPRAEYSRAVAINKRLANSLSPETM